METVREECVTETIQGGMVTGGSWSAEAHQKAKGTGSDRVAAVLLEVRRRHGYAPLSVENARGSVKAWREDVLSGKIRIDGITVPPRVKDDWPKNRGALDALTEKFGILGFRWATGRRTDKVKGLPGAPSKEVERKWVEIINAPKVGGHTPDIATLLLIDPDMVDGYKNAVNASANANLIGKPEGREVQKVRARMNATNVGYKGFPEGVSWLQMIEPFKLPGDFLDRIGQIGRALSLGFKAVRACYESDTSLRHLLNFGKPDCIPELMLGDHVGLMRPDIVVHKDIVTGELRPVITELESCPGGQGMAHAMEVGYGLPTTMLDGYIRWLRGRKLRVIATSDWSEYTWEQACFIEALRKKGVDAEIWFDSPLRKIHERVQIEWTPHIDIPHEIRARWDRDFLGRLKRCGFDEFVHGSDEGMPDVLGSNYVVCRFGYFDNLLKTGAIQLMTQWQRQGTLIANPLWHSLESKMLMAAFWHPSVTAWMEERDPDALVELQNGIAQTYPITGFPAEVRERRTEWTTKVAAYDGANLSWGSRGVYFGQQFGAKAWDAHLTECAAKPYPIVTQMFIKSEQFPVVYRDTHGVIRADHGNRTRVTPFILFHDDAEGTIDVPGSTISLCPDTLKIHGTSRTKEGPILYVRETR